MDLRWVSFGLAVVLLGCAAQNGGNGPKPDAGDPPIIGDGDGGLPPGVVIGMSLCPLPTVGGADPAIAGFAAGDDPAVLAVDGRKGVWYTYPDAVAMKVTSGALVASASAATAVDSGVGMQLNGQGPLSCAHNATAFRGVRFAVKSATLTEVAFLVAQGWTTPIAEGGTCREECYNHHRVVVPVSPEWQTVEIAWDQLQPAGWGQAVPFDPRQLTQLSWELPKNAAFELSIDDVAFLPGGSLDASAPPGYGGGPGGPSCGAESLIVDDLETASQSASRWYHVPGEAAGTPQVDTPLIVAVPEGGKAVRLKGGGLASVDVVRPLDDAGECFTTSASGVTLRIQSEKARTLKVRLPLTTNTPVSEGGACTFTDAQCAQGNGDCCYDYHEAALAVTPGWKTYELPFSRFFQQGFGRAIDLEFAKALRLEIGVTSAASFDLWIDDVALLPGGGTGPIGEACAGSTTGNVPFGSKPVAYASGAALPAGVSDQAVQQAYNQWANLYLEAACGGYVVDTLSDTGAYTVSEAMGYGMILTAFFADKARFDGLWRVTRGARSPVVNDFMSWRLGTSCQPESDFDRRSATDGDMDIAFALMLADRQWGSGGAVDYRAEAYEIIQSLAQWTLGPDLDFVKLGDWVGTDSGVLRTTMRPSDFMPDHFRTFAEVTGDSRWDTAVVNVYATLASVQGQTVGHVPDFVVGADTSPAPAPGQVLESGADGTYGVNACRVPWRIGVDYLMNGEARAKAFLAKLTTWAEGTSGGNPGGFVGKYWPDGDPYSSDTQGALFYSGPLGVGAMARGGSAWLDKLWTHTRSAGATVYYQDTLRVLTLVAMSGNWWSPHRVPCD